MLLQHVNAPVQYRGNKLPPSANKKKNQFLYLDSRVVPIRNCSPAVTKRARNLANSRSKARLLPAADRRLHSGQTHRGHCNPGKWEDDNVRRGLASYVADGSRPSTPLTTSTASSSDTKWVNDSFAPHSSTAYSFFPHAPNAANLISDPTDHCIRSLLSSHSWLETVSTTTATPVAASKRLTDELIRNVTIRGRRGSPANLRRFHDVGSMATAWKTPSAPVYPLISCSCFYKCDNTGCVCRHPSDTSDPSRSANAELHLHLEGMLLHERVRALAQKYSVLSHGRKSPNSRL